jgi:hypothetical protein
VIDIGDPIIQGAAPHGPRQLGHGPRTFALAGCLLACWTMAARAITGNRGLTILEAHHRIMAAGGFAGSGLRRHVASRVLGLRMVDPDGSEPFDRAQLVEELRHAYPVILGLDYKPGRSSGFSDADHFVLAVSHESGSVGYVDPATGTTRHLLLGGPSYRGVPAIVAEMVRFAVLPQ